MPPIESIRVLVVDDEPDIGVQCKFYLERSKDIEVDAVSSVAGALESLAQKNFDAIVSDYQMPGEDGIQFLKSLRGSGDQIPFILLTGKGREEVVIEALNSGADSYLQKGGKPTPLYAELEHRIRTAVRKYRTDLDLAQRNCELLKANYELAAAEQEMAAQLEEIRAGIDEMAESKEELWESEEKSRALLMNLTTGIVVHALDTTILFSNPMASSLLGLTEDQMKGRVAADTYWSFLREDGTPMPLAEYPVNRVLSSREPFIGLVLGIVRSDRDEPTWVLCSAYQNRDRRSRFQNVVVTLTDITARKRTEEALIAREEYLRTILQTTADGFWMVDVHGKVMDVNETYCRMSGYTRNELLEMCIPDLDAIKTPEEQTAIIESIIANGSGIFETRHRRKDGSVFDVELTVTYQSTNGGILVCFCRDITKRKIVEKLTADAQYKERSLRDEAEERLTRSPDISLDLEEQETTRLIHELQVHQIELEMQAQELRTAHIALEESRDKYFDLYENAPVGYLTLTDKGLVMAANITSANLLGLARNQLLNKRFSKFIIDEDSSAWHRHFMKVLKERERQPCSLTLKRANGSVFPVQMETVWAIDAVSGAPRVWMTISDVSEVRRVEDELRECKTRFDHLAEHSGTITWQMDARGTYTYVSGVCEAILGYLPEELVGKKHFYDLHPEAGREAFKRAAFDILERKERFHDLVNPMQAKDGHVVWVSTNGIPLVDAEGYLQGYQGNSIDMTERKRAEEALNESSTYARRLIEASLDPLVTIDTNGKVTDANAATLEQIGIARENIIGTEFSQYFTDPQKAEEGYLKAFKEGEVRDFPLTLIGHSGRRVDVIYNASVYLDGKGHVKGVFAAARDVTERKQAEDALRSASIKLSILNSITRHDIINQMMVLSGFLEMCKQRENDSHLVEYFDKMTHAAENVQRQIAFTKEYQDIGVKAPVWASPGRKTEEAFAMLCQKGVVLQDDAEDVDILVDPMVEKVPYNLIDNSMRHGERVSRIRISTEQVEEAMLVVYEDDGVGINNEEKKHLFERGFGKHTGFGLFLIKEILGITGITIAERGKAGEGVRFEMLVPPGAWRRRPME